MSREELAKKYAAELEEMAQHESGDISVLIDKLIYMGRNGANAAEKYYIPAALDMAAFMADVKALG